jgi:hypothetical protein
MRLGGQRLLRFAETCCAVRDDAIPVKRPVMDVCDLNKPVSQKGLGSDSGLDQGIDSSTTIPKRCIVL